MGKRVTPIEVRDSLEELLQISTMMLATLGIGGEPHAAAVYYTCDEQLNFYFFSDEHSQHSLDIAHHQQAALTVHPEINGWQEIRGLQLRGMAALVQTQSDREHTWERYAGKFPFVGQLEEIVLENKMYVFAPHWSAWWTTGRGEDCEQVWWSRL